MADNKLNTFCLLERRKASTAKNKSHSKAIDEDAQRDRARLIHSAAFRRLQAKTQIFSVGENDFHRTRLTHSLEVAQIGSGICEYLRNDQKIDKQHSQWIASLSQMEAICLAHDIGHPPFGHGGESALNYFMHKHGGFEGNGQTLRIASKLGEYSENHGLNLTRRTMLGLLKYPVTHKQVAGSYPNSQNQAKLTLNDYKPPKCIHDDEEDVLKWILSPFPQIDQDEFQKTKNSKSQYKSFDTSIMELADDIAYGVHDLEDALALNLINKEQWQEQVVDRLIGKGIFANQTKNEFNQQLFSPSNNKRKFIISQLVFYFIHNISICPQAVFQTPLLDLQATMSNEAKSNLNILIEFVFKYVIKTQEVKMHEYKGQQIIKKLFQALIDDSERLLPTSTQNKLNKDSNDYRIICDYIAGMTDNYAIKVYKKLF
jgi:dGTPase